KNGKLVLTIGAMNIESINSVLAGRIPFGRPLQLASKKAVVQLEPAETFSYDIEDDAIVIKLPAAAAREFVQIVPPKRGEYYLATAPDLVIRIVPSEIKDETGRRVIRVIG